MSIFDSVHRYVIRPLWDRHQGLHYSRYYDEVSSLQAIPEQMRTKQMLALRRLVAHAYRHIPHYKDIFDRNSIRPQDIQDFKDFERIPILTKDELRSDHPSFVNPNVDQSQLIRSGTGGTTDSPIPILYDRKRNDIKTAEMVYFRKWFQWYPESKVAYLWGAPMDIPNMQSLKQKLKALFILRNMFLFASILNAEIMDDYLGLLHRFKPQIIQAYTNPIYILSNYILESGRRVDKPKAVIVTAEPCYPSQRAVIERAFNCPVYAFYGAREAGYIGVECATHRHYHINTHGVYLEIIKDGKPAAPGEIGDVVITDLQNDVMPLIRYRIGDMASMSPDEECACGSRLPMLDFMAGRETDVFVLPHGDLVPGVSLCDRVIQDCSGIAQMQFVQEQPDTLQVKIVRGKNFTESDEIKLDQVLEEYFHHTLHIEKIFVDDIPKERSGKTRFCISTVPALPGLNNQR